MLRKTRKQKALEATPADRTETAAEDAVKTDAQKIDEQMKNEASENEQEVVQDEEVSEPAPDEKHIMFETDNFIDCLNTAVWFGQKVPAKRRMFGRGSYHK